jgi:hypothetical protein
MEGTFPLHRILLPALANIHCRYVMVVVSVGAATPTAIDEDPLLLESLLVPVEAELSSRASAPA